MAATAKQVSYLNSLIRQATDCGISPYRDIRVDPSRMTKIQASAAIDAVKDLLTK